MTAIDKKISAKTIERIFKYKQVLINYETQGKQFIFSHELATTTNGTPAQVRRDLMEIPLKGTPQKGYNVPDLQREIQKLLDMDGNQKAALVGVGHLGSAILAYFNRRRPKVSIVAAFDVDPDKADRVIGGCKTYRISELERKIFEEKITIGIITVPADYAQAVATKMMMAGIKGIVNFAPIHLKVGKAVYIENVDITLAIEKTAFYSNTLRR